MIDFRGLYKALAFSTLFSVVLAGGAYWLSAAWLIALLVVMPLYLSLVLTVLGGTLAFGLFTAAALYSAIIFLVSLRGFSGAFFQSNFQLSAILVLCTLISCYFTVKASMALCHEYKEMV